MPSAAQTFQQANDAPEIYYVVKGTLAFDPAMMPEGGSNDAEGAQVPATLTGYALSAEGFTSPFSAPVTLDVGCAGPWCGGIGQGAHIAFIRQDAGGWTLDVGPCPGSAFEASAEVEAEVIACMQGGC